ncbi:succinate dehydrogenase/fumarate reductase iron-sulfur subunit [Desulfovirgula thermocuniculi]|uniref:succinate dehydrogenase/fumarate reductase iron-sulfur subunit n=1 Tax=Desulfovirgula thermocuniculi TaxID=348842 RepID=UPI0004139D3A|nr:2Fe-2S iron-sulfur cluster-binding protein [Desulfovirgula thermocuniculi]
MRVTLKVSRFDPAKDRQPYLQEFVVEVGEKQTVLDALLHAWEVDPTLSFRRSCRSAICGSCAVSINGRPALACQTLVGSAVAEGGVITLEPLPHFRRLKDLVVDLEPFFASLQAVLPWVVTREDHDGLMDPEVARKLEGPATCILCGVCDAAIEVAGEVKPAALVKGLRLALDPRDALGAARLQLMKVPPEILRLFVRELTQKCPKGIKIAFGEGES